MGRHVYFRLMYLSQKTHTCTSPFPEKKAGFKSESSCVLESLSVFSTCVCWSKQRSCLSVVVSVLYPLSTTAAVILSLLKIML